jgi:hypothetical protein
MSSATVCSLAMRIASFVPRLDPRSNSSRFWRRRIPPGSSGAERRSIDGSPGVPCDRPSAPMLGRAALRPPPEHGRRVVIVSGVLSVEYRPMEAGDVGVLPSAQQGDEDEIRRRIACLGSSAWLAFDGVRHVGQLQFRRFEPRIRSPNGVWGPLWWMDFAGRSRARPVHAGGLLLSRRSSGQHRQT